MSKRNNKESMFFYLELLDCLRSTFFLSGVALALFVWIIDPFIDAVFLQLGTIHDLIFQPDIHQIYMRSFISVPIIILSFIGSVLLNRSRQVVDKFNEVNAQLNSIIESEPECVKTVAKDGTLLSMNPAGLALVEAESFDEVDGVSIYDLIAPEHRENFINLNKRIFEGESVVLEYEIIGLKGGRKWLETHATPLFDNSRTIIAQLAVTRNITERKQAEGELQRIKWLLKSKDNIEKPFKPEYGDLTEINTSRLLLDSVGKDILEGMADDYLGLLETSGAIYETNGDYALGLFSSGWCQFLDGTSRKLCATDDNRKALECGKWLCHESCWNEASKISIEKGQPVDIECNGGINLYAIPIRAGNETVGSINFGYGDPPRDLQKLKEIADTYKVNLDELTERANSYESRPPYIIQIAKQRLQVSANLIGAITERKQAEEALQQRTHDLGERVKELTGLYSISRILDHQDISLEENLELIAEVLPPAWHYPEITCARITFDGREFTTENFKETIWRQASEIIVNGEQVGVVEVYYLEEKPELDEGPFLKEERNLIDDIAARLAETIEHKLMENETKQLREELTHVERINTVGEMTAALAYELKQYLLTISNYAYSCVNKLYSGKNEPDAYLADMESISKQAGRASDLLTHVQNFVHRKKPCKDTLDVNQLVREIVDLILTEANSSQVTIMLDLDDNLPSTKGDPIQLQQVILNLARNSIEAMQKTDLSSRRLTITTAEYEEGMVAVTISDLGSGVSTKDEDNLFTHFFTTKAHGLGLGLSICRTIIEAHGGKIGFVPDIKIGAVVRFTLPVDDEGSADDN